MLYIRVGDAYRLDKEYLKAKEQYEKALLLDPADKFALYGMKRVHELLSGISSKDKKDEEHEII